MAQGFAGMTPAQQAAQLYRIMHGGNFTQPEMAQLPPIPDEFPFPTGVDPNSEEGMEARGRAYFQQADRERNAADAARRLAHINAVKQLGYARGANGQTTVQDRYRAPGDWMAQHRPPAELAPWERQERSAPQGRTYVVENMGSLQPMREIALARMGEVGASAVDLGESLEHLRYLAANKPPKGPPKPRPLPAKIGMEGIWDTVALQKRDIKLIKDAQSKVGAENWIRKHGLMDKLYVDDRDFDGDNIPDIIVRNRANHEPYIVKGYTTEQSSYPNRFSYFSQYPTAADRKGHPMSDYHEDAFVDSYRWDGQERKLKPEAVERDKLAVSVGYKQARPPIKLTPVQAFKKFIMHPVMNTVKGWFKAHGTPLQLAKEIPAKIESAIRTNLIIAPVMVRVYGDRIFDVVQDPHEWHKLTQRKEVRDSIAALTGEIVENRQTFTRAFLETVLQVMLQVGVQFPIPQEQFPDALDNMEGHINQLKAWIAPTLARRVVAE
jgi:hypothetical protein